jgi:hypothetical protein
VLPVRRLQAAEYRMGEELRSVLVLLDVLVFLQPEGCAPMASRVLGRGGTVEMHLPGFFPAQLLLLSSLPRFIPPSTPCELASV